MPSNKTRERIIATAKQLFAEKGFEGVRTKEIAKLSGVSEVTLFKYFPKKEFLYLSVKSNGFKITDVYKIIKENADESFENLIKELVITMADDFYDNKEIISMDMKEKKRFMPDKKMRRMDAHLYAVLIPYFMENEKNGTIKIPHRTAVNILVKSIKGLFMESLMEGTEKEEFLSLINSFVGVYLYGIIKE